VTVSADQAKVIKEGTETLNNIILFNIVVLILDKKKSYSK
jgi:hypothetical protein